MRVIILPEVDDYFADLVEILYRKEYFGFQASARGYVTELLDAIRDTLPMRVHRAAPRRFDRYGAGMQYATFRRNRATTWYVFFTKYDDGGEIVYLIHHIENNHTAAQYM